jgi:probable Rubsico expression protein CbbX
VTGTGAAGGAETLDLAALAAQSDVRSILDGLERDLVGVAPLKARLREIAALLVVERARSQMGLATGTPTLHMCFTGNPGTGKTTVARRLGEILRGLGHLRRGHLVAATRDDLVGQWVGHTAPKTKQVIEKALGGVLFIDEAYGLVRPENERDYGQEAVEILVQAMEDRRDDLAVVFAGYRDRMEAFLGCNPGLASRIAHHVDFPDFTSAELIAIAELMLERMHYELSPAARDALAEYVELRMRQPRFANARSIRNALDRARLRHANRLFSAPGVVDRAALRTIEADDLRRSRVFLARSGTETP